MICNACRRTAARAVPLHRATPYLVSQRAPSSYTQRLPRASAARSYATNPYTPNGGVPPPDDIPVMSPAETLIADVLREKLAPTTELLVQDVSGGCGSMYAIEIASAQFKGLTMLKQQRLVNAALGDMVKGWHGVQIRTKVPEE
ncbi:hypothetical protein S7711_03712 [Stachybotrys chartarum IBT 7711]|uniref:Bola-like protein n=1 Tax=Stachybotrys chartarum (strain CBS 109288 / IBT 7711) TaxID=1280523 RepID=A0A084B7M5_STACB|nr:hypothetical protein S7711_03712 [Stachybotrys chartarum IBT 7711]KFA48243.1 hypothetical protein S40293_07365 [Stachybotrys chartarum IBT 40293]KFA80693.1 hypothetical protein S40288_01813 [Stachybotrys chartarum IBT 40288]